MIGLLVPTRGRPSQCARLVESVCLHSLKPEKVKFYFGVNDDDPTNQELLKTLGECSRKWGELKWHVQFYHKDRLGRFIWNDLAEIALKEGASMVWAGSDDILFEDRFAGKDVPPWDYTLEAVRRHAEEAWPDKNYILWGWDGSCGARHATHPFVTKEWLRSVGYLMPLVCKHFDGDTFLTELAVKMGRGVYVESIVTRHLNPKYGLAEKDETWTRMRPVQNEDYAAYRGPEGIKERNEALERLKNGIARSRTHPVSPLGPNLPKDSEHGEYPGG